MEAGMANDACKPLSFGSKPFSLARLSVVVGLSVAVLIPGQQPGFPQHVHDATVTPAIEATSALGQALAACEKDALEEGNEDYRQDSSNDVHQGQGKQG